MVDAGEANSYWGGMVAYAFKVRGRTQLTLHLAVTDLFSQQVLADNAFAAAGAQWKFITGLTLVPTAVASEEFPFEVTSVVTVGVPDNRMRCRCPRVHLSVGALRPTGLNSAPPLTNIRRGEAGFMPCGKGASGRSARDSG